MLEPVINFGTQGKEVREIDPESLNMSAWEIEAVLGIRAM
jgi:hypothetical protein